MDQLPQLLTDAIVVLIFTFSLVELFRRRDLPRLEIAALFGTVAPLAAAQAVELVVGDLPPWVGTVGIALLLAQPYALMRVTEHFTPIPRVQHFLMDVQLPGEDGLSLTRRLKADPATAAIQVVALTAHAMPDDRERVLAAGCDGYLTKPINTRTLAVEVAAYLAAR